MKTEKLGWRVSIPVVHASVMKHLTLVILLALAPLGWSNEELKLYCQRDAVHERVYTDSVESTGWTKNDFLFEPNERGQFLVKVDSQNIKVVGHPFFGELELVTKKFSRSEHLNSVNAITVEGFTDGNRPFSFRLGGLLENGISPYILARSGFSQQPFLNYDVGTCSKP